jgi:hypothetical protein
MSISKIAPFALCVPSLLSIRAADRKASIAPAPSVAASVTAPVLGSFATSAGVVVIEGIPGAAHARINDCADCVLHVSGSQGRSRTLRGISLPAGVTHVSTFDTSDDASRTLIATDSGVYENSDRSWRLVTADTAGALAFIPKTRDALLASRDQLYLLKDGSLRVVTTQGIISPVAIAATDDGRSAVVLNAGGTDLRIIDLATNASRALTLGSVATNIQRGNGAVLIFIPKQGASPWLLDTRTGQLSFAPELPGSAGGR